MNDEILLLRLNKTEYKALKGVLVLEEYQEEMIENAEPTTRGFVVSGSWNDFDNLAGCVAAEANHTESSRKEAVLDKVYGKIEDLLGESKASCPIVPSLQARPALKLTLTKAQYRELLKAIYIGVYVREAVAEMNEAPDRQEIQEIETHVLSAAGDFDCEDMAELFCGKWIPADDFCEEMQEEIEEYINLEFWEELVTRLGQRDFARTITNKERKEMDENDGIYPDRIRDIYRKWGDEFEKFGLSRLEVKKK